MASKITLVFDNSYSIAVAIIIFFSFTNGFIIDVRYPNVLIDMTTSNSS